MEKNVMETLSISIHLAIDQSFRRKRVDAVRVASLINSIIPNFNSLSFFMEKFVGTWEHNKAPWINQ